jgi:hypothetical protein
MKKFIVRVNNGFNFEYHSMVEAETVFKARKEFLTKHKGDWFDTPGGVKLSEVKEDNNVRHDSV